MLIGYASCSADVHDVTAQHDRLTALGRITPTATEVQRKVDILDHMKHDHHEEQSRDGGGLPIGACA